MHSITKLNPIDFINVDTEKNNKIILNDYVESHRRYVIKLYTEVNTKLSNQKEKTD